MIEGGETTAATVMLDYYVIQMGARMKAIYSCVWKGASTGLERASTEYNDLASCTS